LLLLLLRLTVPVFDSRCVLGECHWKYST